MKRICVHKDLQPIVNKLGDFWREHPDVLERLRKAHTLALAESAQDHQEIEHCAGMVLDCLKTAALLLVSEEICPGTLDEMFAAYQKTLNEIYPRLLEGPASDNDDSDD